MKMKVRLVQFTLRTAAIFAMSARSQTAGTQMIEINAGAAGGGAQAYGVNPLHVPVGTKVVWHNSDLMPHTATSDTGVWDTGTIGPSTASAAITFQNPGNFPYHCRIHGMGSMTGLIVVP